MNRKYDYLDAECPHCHEDGTLYPRDYLKTDRPRYICHSCGRKTRDPIYGPNFDSGQSHVSKTSEEVQGNARILTRSALLSDVPQSERDLIEWFDIDTDVWMINKFVANFWGNAKNPNVQVKAWMVKREPDYQKFPVVQPIRIEGNAFKKTKSRPKVKSKYLGLVIPDSQTGFRRDMNTGYLDPFHDRRALDVCAAVAEDLKPDVIVIGGDMFDFPLYTDKYQRSPEFRQTTQPAILENFWWLRRLAATGAEMIYLEGNHEIRLTNFTIKNTEESHGLRRPLEMDGPDLISVPSLLNLDELGVDYRGPYGEGEFWFNDNLCAHHGDIVRSGGGKTVEEILKDARYSQIVCHIHRVEAAHKTKRGRNGHYVYGAYSPGCTCRLEKGIVPAAKSFNDWQQGLGVVRFDLDWWFHADMNVIVNGVIGVGDHMYEARPYSEVTTQVADEMNLPRLLK